MNVAVNGRFLARPITGGERYGREILRFLGDRLRVLRPAERRDGWQGHAWEQLSLPQKLRNDEILWSPINTGPLTVRNQIVTIHDLSPMEHPEWYRPAFSLWYRVLWPELLQRVKHLLTPSEIVRKKVLTRFGLPSDKVTAIPSGVDVEKFRPGNAPKQKYLLFVGSLAPRKNLSGLLQAWEIIMHKHPAYSLKIVGAGGNVFRANKYSRIPDRANWTGYVSENELPVLYAQASLFILPSFDEGFGLPMLEAMASGTPVIAARAGALPEIVGTAGLLFDPHDPQDIGAAIDRVLSDPSLHQRLREEGLAHAANFSWPAAAEKTWQVLQA